MDDIDDLASRVDLHDAIQTAVHRAFYYWLDETNYVRVERCIEDAVHAAMKEWLDEQMPDLPKLIAKRFAFPNRDD